MNETAMPLDQETTPDTAAEVGEVLAGQDDLHLRQGDVRIIVALLKTSRRQDAVPLSGVSRATLYRRLGQPYFRRALQVAEKLHLHEEAWDAAEQLRAACAQPTDSIAAPSAAVADTAPGGL
jgi:hypothetical protein